MSSRVDGEHRIFLGGVPFGNQNVGDEAILECTVRAIRETVPDACITVSTNDEAGTARRLDVRTCPLYGFRSDFDRAEAIYVLREHDVYIWSGATGLSDYPEASLRVLEAAQAAGCRTALFGVGMNRELNPALYRLLPGKRLRALRLLSRASLGMVDGIAWEEQRIQARARRKIRQYLTRADLVVVRDADTCEQVRACGVTRNVIVGADAALTLQPKDLETIDLPERVRALLGGHDGPKVGICISAQREVQQRRDLVQYVNRLTRELNARIFFVPMDPDADARVMAGIHADMDHPDLAAMLEGEHEPAAIAGVAGKLDLVVSSRLHLLILASISHVPIVGISRGSKVDTFVSQFGVRPCGTTERCNFETLWGESVRLLQTQNAFAAASGTVRAELLCRFESALGALGNLIRQCGAVAREGS